MATTLAPITSIASADLDDVTIMFTFTPGSAVGQTEIAFSDDPASPAAVVLLLADALQRLDDYVRAYAWAMEGDQ